MGTMHPTREDGTELKYAENTGYLFMTHLSIQFHPNGKLHLHGNMGHLYHGRKVMF